MRYLSRCCLLGDWDLRLSSSRSFIMHAMRSSLQRRDITLGIRREDKNIWEGRTPLPPKFVAALIENWKVSGKTGSDPPTVVVQPCKKRVYSNEEYEKAGALIQDDLSGCDLILGVKEVPLKSLLADKIYFFFSHTIKGQAYNMPLLEKILQSGISLVDYELMVDSKGKRTIMFGHYAGCAGAVDILNGLGQRMLARGYRTPWLHVSPCRYYEDLAAAKDSIKRVGRMLDMSPPSLELGPFVFTVTGDGNVARGALEILTCMPHQMVTLEELSRLYTHGFDPRKIYIYQALPHDYLVKSSQLEDSSKQDKKSTDEEEDGGNGSTEVPVGGFSNAEYRQYPHLYKSVFHERIFPFTTVLINGIYWDAKYPRLVTTVQLDALIDSARSKSGAAERLRLACIADISCDVEGSLEFMTRVTAIDSPFCYYGTVQKENDIVQAKSLLSKAESIYDILIMSVDNLPAELPRDASKYFGGLLLPYLDFFLKELGGVNSSKTNKRASEAASDTLALTTHPILKNSFITVKGKLVEPRFSYLRPLIEKAMSEASASNLKPSNNKSTEATTALPNKRILLLGAGLVSGPVIHYFGGKAGYEMTIAASESQNIHCKNHNNVKFEKFNVDSEGPQLENLVQQHDIVISLLPAKFHPLIAQVCIRHGRDMVTASYVSPEMAALNDAARAANIRILNEIGLDPGLDHMTAMQIIDRVRAQGGYVKSFESYCGGLPAPEDSRNPLGYKFSWSPRGVLLATLNAARFKKDGNIVEIPAGGAVMRQVVPLDTFKGLALEGYPNRDSLQYEKIYGLDKGTVADMFRGTLRYRGYAHLMTAFQALGLFSSDSLRMRDFALVNHWSDAMKILLESDVHSFEEALAEKLSKYKEIDPHQVYEALSWLGAFSLHEPFCQRVAEKTTMALAKDSVSALSLGDEDRPKSLLDAFCALLERKLAFKEGERDFVLLTHTFKVILPSGRASSRGEADAASSLQESSYELFQEHTCSLVMYGDSKRAETDTLTDIASTSSAAVSAPSPPVFSAMAKTVGYPVALATELLLHAPKPPSASDQHVPAATSPMDGKDTPASASGHVDASNASYIPLGVILPIHKSIYEPILDACPALGITFKESVSQTPTLFH